MINLTPIAKNIQKRLFEKMKVLGRETSTAPNQPAKGSGELTHAKMATRSTFLRMTSGALNAVVLMGGKMKDTGFLGTTPGGYDDIYGPRVYARQSEDLTGLETSKYTRGVKSQFDNLNEEEMFRAGEVGLTEYKTVNNKFKRPIPGVKSIDVTFKGGVRALREATISWTCWSWEDLDILENHFLAHGKTVMVEWGWVYDKDTLQKLPNFFEIDALGNRSISADAFTDYRNKIIEADGDFDMMVGMIKNFEWTTREDGGFDCQTILTSVGASIMENPQPSQEALDPSITYNISIKDDTKTVQKALEKATGELGEQKKKGYNPKSGPEDINSLVDLNTNVTMKAFVKNIDDYVLEQLNTDLNQTRGKTTRTKYEKVSKNGTVQTNNFGGPNNYTGKNNFRIGGKRIGEGELKKNYYKYTPNKYITRITEVISGNVKGEVIDDVWVKWGWFEDNILSKFLSVTSDERIITEFRSIEKLQMVDGKDSQIYESVRIKNHERLETTNLTQFILPGQFVPQPPITLDDVLAGADDFDGEQTVKLPGDKDYIQILSTITNDINNFKPFATKNSDVIERVGFSVERTSIAVMKKIKDEENSTWYKTVYKDSQEGTGEFKTEYNTKIVDEEIPSPGKHGYLRNMLINTKLIKKAFGVSKTDEFTVESINFIEAIESMFSLLNQELNFWNLNVTVDEIDTHRAKIIDDQIVNHKFDRSTDEQKSFVDENGNVYSIDNEGNQGDEGVFFFPVWQHDSLVKRQNVSAKIPDTLQLSIMYGANMDVVKDFGNPGSQFADKRGIIAGGLHNDYGDKSNKGIDIAFRNKTSRNIGLKSSEESIPLQKNGGENIIDFIKNNTEELEVAYEKRLHELNQSIRASSDTRIEEPDLPFDPSVPPPLFNYLTRAELTSLLEIFNKAVVGDNPLNKKAKELYSQKFNDDGSIRTPFLQSIRFRTSNYGTGAQVTTPILVPLELELDIDGIGGIYPGNSFHSTYVPSKYQKLTVFQCFDVNHRLDSSGWTTTISGKMRSTIDSAFKFAYTDSEITRKQKENYANVAENEFADRARVLSNLPYYISND